MGKIDWEYARYVLNAAETALGQPMEDATEQIASIYRERAQKLAHPPVPVDSGAATAPVLVFQLAKERYGVELADISTVLGTIRSTPVPESEAKLEGLINVHGNVRPVLNLRFLLNLPAADRNAPEYFLVLRQQQRELGVKVEDVESVHHIRLQDLQIAAGDTMAPWIRGVTSDSLTVLHTKALFAEFWSERSES
jgi:chemotaxis signal transduction protein